MPLDIQSDINVNLPVRARACRKSLSSTLPSSFRLVSKTRLTAQEMREYREVGLVTYDPRKDPPKFRLYVSWQQRQKAAAFPFAGYNRDKKCWYVPVSPETLRYLSHFFPNFKATESGLAKLMELKEQAREERSLLRHLRDLKTGKASTDHIKSFGLPLWDIQKICVAFIEEAWDQETGVLNLCEQGTGKTPTTLVVLDRFLEENPLARAIVFAPLSTLKTTWVSLCRMFTKNVRPMVPVGSIPERAQMVDYASTYDWEEEYVQDDLVRTRFVRVVGRPNVILVNHEIGGVADRHDEKAKNILIETLREWAGEEDTNLVADEVHKFANPSAKRTKAAEYIKENCLNFLGLTGTPGMPEKFYGITRITDRRIFPVNKTDFKGRYLDILDLEDFEKITGYRNLEELQKRTSQYSVRYKQEDCLDIPDWMILSETVEMSDEQSKAYKAIEQENRVFYGERNITKTNIGGRLHGLRNVTGGYVKDTGGAYVRFKRNGKLSRLIEKLEDELEANPNHPEHIRKAMISCAYLEDVAIITEHLKALAKKRGRWKEWKHVVITSQVTDKKTKTPRSDAVKAFVEDPKTRILIGTQDAIKEGLNLVPKLPQVCDIMFIWSPGYSPEAMDQLIKRIIRHGQTRKVRIVYLVCEGTMDESILDALKQKKNICDIATGDNLRSLTLGRVAA